MVSAPPQASGCLLSCTGAPILYPFRFRRPQFPKRHLNNSTLCYIVSCLQGQGRRGNVFLCDNLDENDGLPARVALRFLARQASNASSDSLNSEISTHWCAHPLHVPGKAGDLQLAAANSSCISRNCPCISNTWSVSLCVRTTDLLCTN